MPFWSILADWIGLNTTSADVEDSTTLVPEGFSRFYLQPWSTPVATT